MTIGVRRQSTKVNAAHSNRKACAVRWPPRRGAAIQCSTRYKIVVSIATQEALSMACACHGGPTPLDLGFVRPARCAKHATTIPSSELCHDGWLHSMVFIRHIPPYRHVGAPIFIRRVPLRRHVGAPSHIHFMSGVHLKADRGTRPTRPRVAWCVETMLAIHRS